MKTTVHYGALYNISHHNTHDHKEFLGSLESYRGVDWCEREKKKSTKENHKRKKYSKVLKQKQKITKKSKNGKAVAGDIFSEVMLCRAREAGEA